MWKCQFGVVSLKIPFYQCVFKSLIQGLYDKTFIFLYVQCVFYVHFSHCLMIVPDIKQNFTMDSLHRLWLQISDAIFNIINVAKFITFK